MKKTITGIFLFVVVVIAVLAYLASIIFCESVTYQKGSLEYYLLTPQIIKELPIQRLNNADYFYSSADGSKPSISSVEFFYKTTGKEISDILSNYFIMNKYLQLKNGSYKKDFQEITVEYKKEKGKTTAKIIVLEYL